MEKTASQQSDKRRERILDAATPLFVRDGYMHTSTNAIAARAGVSKATLYAYWSSKEQLFHALIIRESLRVLQLWEAAVMTDPLGGMVGPLFAHGFQALRTSPLLLALYGQDRASSGALFRQRGPMFYTQRYRQSLEFVRELQQQQMIRDDLPAETINHVLETISIGLLTIGDFVDAGVMPDFTAIATTLADTMQRALSPTTPASPERGKSIIYAHFSTLRRHLLAGTIQPLTAEESK